MNRLFKQTHMFLLCSAVFSREPSTSLNLLLVVFRFSAEFLIYFTLSNPPPPGSYHTHRVLLLQQLLQTERERVHIRWVFSIQEGCVAKVVCFLDADCDCDFHFCRNHHAQNPPEDRDKGIDGRRRDIALRTIVRHHALGFFGALRPNPPEQRAVQSLSALPLPRSFIRPDSKDGYVIAVATVTMTTRRLGILYGVLMQEEYMSIHGPTHNAT